MTPHPMTPHPLTPHPSASPGHGRPLLATTLPSFAATDPGDWTFLFDRAEAADRAGIDRVLVSDHVVFGERLDEYGRPEVGGTAGGRQPTGPDGHWLEPLTVLTAVAARTTRVRLGTNILLAALRRPVVLAKTLATLDVLSGGRVDLGVGVGWQREEYDAAGLSFEDRGRLLDHTLAVLQALWREDTAEFADDLLRFEHIHAMPKPRQPGGVPIWVSGTVNRLVARRIARFGSGWIPWGPAAGDVAAALPPLRALVEDAGGSFDGIRVAASLPVVRDATGDVDLAATVAPAAALAAAGVTDITVSMPMPAGASAAFDTYAALADAYTAALG